MDYAFTIHPAMDPGASRTVARDESGLAHSGLRFSASPEGDCLEMTFEADNAALGLQPLDTVRLLVRNGPLWTPLWTGEVREGGNIYRGWQGFRLYGLSRLFDTAILPERAYPEADVAVIVRQAIRDCLTAARLPPSITVRDEDVPLAGANWAISRTNQQMLGALLTAASARTGGSVWGVRADGRFFFGPRRLDTYALPASAGVKWRTPSAEHPITAVLWFYQREGEAGAHTHLSTMPGALGDYGVRAARVVVNMPFRADQSHVVHIHPQLDAWAQWAYRLPAPTPARATVRQLILPTEYRGRMAVSAAAVPLTVETWETTITVARGVETHINAGQADDAGMEALAAAITRNAEQSSWKGAVML